MLSIGVLLQHYKKPEIQKAMFECADEKEIAVKFGDKGFGKRPDTIQYPFDILEMAKQGATSFHFSEENWYNPLRLETELNKKEIDDLRKSWDLVLDIDCKWLEYSAIAADLLIKALNYHSIKSISCKFSGNHGFHIAVPAESFPKKVFETETRLLFPEAPKRIALYLKHMIRKKLAERILKIDGISAIVKKTGKKFDELVKSNAFDPFEILEIDTLLISSRHMLRMPYSFNEKSGLLSIPIDPDKVIEFDKASAAPEKYVFNPKFRFLSRDGVKKDEAKELLIQAYDFSVKEGDRIKDVVEKRDNEKKSFEFLQEAIPEDFFPPCVKLVLNGVKDGKKRSLFMLVNFLTCCGWDYERIRQAIEKWNLNNEKSYEQLRPVLINAQLRYHKQMNKKMPPPNCDNKAYYTDIGVCKPDELCKRIKNPVQYAKRRLYFFNQDKQKASKGRKKKEGNAAKDSKQSKK